MWFSVVATGVGLVAVAVWGLLTQPPAGQVAGTIAIALLILVLGTLVGRRTFLDTAGGAVVRDIWGVRRRTVPWADVDVLRIRANNAGLALLEVRRRGERTSIYLPLVAADAGGDRSQPPDLLRVLADEIERWAPSREAVVRALRGQAEHVEAGRPVRESPIVRAHLRVRQ